MADRWFYAVGEERRGPVEKDELLRMISDGRLRKTTLVWTRTLADWTPAGEIGELSDAAWPVPGADDTAPLRTKPGTAAKKPSGGAVLRQIGKKLSSLADLPTISRMPVREMLIGGLARSARTEDMEETFAVGTSTTTPPLSAIPDGWPTPRVFWRVLLGALAAYALLRVANPSVDTGIVIVGSFLVPLAIVILFFELDTPRNVSVYQVGKLLLAGGALALILTPLLARLLRGSEAGQLVPAVVAAVVEETAKGLILLIVVSNRRWKWQLNGLLFGAAVGAGFAGFASAGHAFGLPAGVGEAFGAVGLRGLLSPGSHVIWTALVGSAIWKARGDRPFEIGMLVSPVVIRRWAIAVVLHGLWDTAIRPPWIKGTVLSLVGGYLVLGVVSQGLEEVSSARKTAAA